jgi:hypothetical protein
MLRRSTRTHCVPSVFDLTPSCCALSGETANNNFIIFRLIHPRAPTYYLLHSRGAPPGSNLLSSTLEGSTPGLQPTIFYTRGEHPPGSNLRSSTLEGSTPRAPTYDLLHSRGAPLGSNLRSSTLEGSTPRAQTYDLLHSRGARYPLHYRSGRTGENIYSNRDVTGGVREKGRKRL